MLHDLTSPCFSRISIGEDQVEWAAATLNDCRWKLRYRTEPGLLADSHGYGTNARIAHRLNFPLHRLVFLKISDARKEASTQTLMIWYKLCHGDGTA
jgi:hypothetical protein